MVGATDAALLPLPFEGAPITHATFAAGIYAHLDVDPGLWLPGVTPFSAWSSDAVRRGPG